MHYNRKYQTKDHKQPQLLTFMMNLG